MWPHLEALCRYDRLSGSPGERAAMDYLLAALAALRRAGAGVRVRRLSLQPRSGRLELLGDDGDTVKAKTRSFSAATSASGVTGELVYVPGNHDMFKDMETHERIPGAGLARQGGAVGGRRPLEHDRGAGAGRSGVRSRVAQRRAVLPRGHGQPRVGPADARDRSRCCRASPSMQITNGGRRAPAGSAPAAGRFRCG